MRPRQKSNLAQSPCPGDDARMTDIRPAWFVFDCESIADGRLIQRIRYPDQPELTPEAAIAQQRAELLERTGSDFIPHTFQLPVSVAVAMVGDDLLLQDLRTIDRPQFRPPAITRRFWDGWRHFGRPTFVTFNGRGFDLPLMELAAFRYGHDLNDWFDTNGPGYQHPRNRFNQSRHLDLQEVLTNFGAVRQNGGLNLLANLVGTAGKMDTKGDMVQDLWLAGEHERIDDYCVCDSLDTYFVFLRCSVLTGRITAERELEVRAQAREMIATKVERYPVLADYLDALHEPVLTSDDRWPFLDAADQG